MSYYRVCEHCGSTLDPGEKCDCVTMTPLERLQEFGRKSASKYCPICKEPCKKEGCAAWVQPKKLWSGDDEKPGYCAFLAPGG